MLYIPTNVSPRHMPMAAVKGGRGIGLSISNLGVRWGWVVYKPCPGHYTPGKSLVPIVEKADWVPGPVWTGVEKLSLATPEVRTPNHPRADILTVLSLPLTNM